MVRLELIKCSLLIIRKLLVLPLEQGVFVGAILIERSRWVTKLVWGRLLRSQIL
jgi:hypothetical protein